jgi:uncharacterized protein YbjT (DUF2867 family)
MKASVIGSTGLVGGHLLRLLANDKSFSEVYSIARRSQDIQHNRIKSIAIDFDNLERYKSSLTTDIVFCALGTTIKKAGSKEQFIKVDYDYVLNSAKICKENGVSKFLVVTALGSDPNSLVFYNQVKGKLEQELGNLQLPFLGIFRPSLLLGERGEVRTGEKFGEILLGGLSFALQGPLRKFRAIRAEDVARAMIQISKEPLSGVNIYESDKIQSIANSA